MNEERIVNSLHRGDVETLYEALQPMQVQMGMLKAYIK